MKGRKYSVKLLLCVLLVSVFLTAVTCTKQSTPAKEITGTVEQTDKGVVITSEEGQYLIAGQDLSSMLGMKVKATGMVTEAEGQRTLTVTSYTEMK